MNAGPHQLEPHYNTWDDWTQSMNANAPADAKLLMISYSWTRMKAELNVVRSTTLSFLSSVLFTSVIVLIFTGNIILSVYTTITIVLTVATLFGFLVKIMNWEFGA